jgi:hypothetical protein
MSGRGALAAIALTLAAAGCGGGTHAAGGSAGGGGGVASPAGSAGAPGSAGAGGGVAGAAGAAGATAGSGTAGAAAATGAGGGSGGSGTGAFATGVRVHLQRTFAAPKVISFGLPVPPGAVPDAGGIRVAMGGAPVAANVKALLAEHDAAGAPKGVRAVLVQLPATILAGDTADVDVVWSGPGSAPGVAAAPFTDVSADSPEVVTTTVRTISAASGVNKLVDGPHVDETLFTGKEPRVLATFPDGYLAATGLLGHQVTQSSLAGGDYAGLAFLSDDLQRFGVSALYDEAYALNPDGVVDPVVNYEGWLYDRCATFLTFYTHTGDARFLRHAYRSCSYYASKIGLSGATAGIFTGKPDIDQKYSHLRGLYAYYALTGDEGALAAGTAIAGMWRADTLFVGPYRMGHLRGPDKLWTERLLGTSLEGLYYGHRLTGDATYLAAFKEMLDTAYRHITGDAAALAIINPGVGPFPPQSCFIHSALQHSEGSATDPWCSIWMSELTIDSLLQYQAQTGDVRVDEIFVRLVRSPRRRLSVHDGRRARRPFSRAQGLLRPDGERRAPPRSDLRLGPHHGRDAQELRRLRRQRALHRRDGAHRRRHPRAHAPGKVRGRARGRHARAVQDRGRLVRGPAPRVRRVRARDVRGRQPPAPRPRGLDERRARRGRGRSGDVHRHEPHRLPEVSDEPAAQTVLVVQHVDAAVRAARRRRREAPGDHARPSPTGTAGDVPLTAEMR